VAAAVAQKKNNINSDSPSYAWSFRACRPPCTSESELQRALYRSFPFRKSSLTCEGSKTKKKKKPSQNPKQNQTQLSSNWDIQVIVESFHIEFLNSHLLLAGERIWKSECLLSSAAKTAKISMLSFASCPFAVP